MNHTITSQHQNGLSWTFDIVIPEKDIQILITSKLKKIAPKAKISGFRPGKVPVSVLNRLYGEQTRIECIQELASNSSDSILKDKKIRAASQPDIVDLKGLKKGEVSFSLRVDEFPKIPLAKLKSLNLQRFDPVVSDIEIDDSLEKMAKHNQRLEELPKPRPCKDNDTLKINFNGAINDIPFPGGKAENYSLQLGAGQFLPEFEKQLLGKNKGDKFDVIITFPSDYSQSNLANKKAVFAVEITDHKQPKSTKIDDSFAKECGLKSVAELKSKVKEGLQSRYLEVESQLARRLLLDVLDKNISFDLPERMIEQEFESIWKELEKAKKNNTLTDEEKKKDDDTLRKEFLEIAERRIKLGLILAEVTKTNDIEVTDQEIAQAIAKESQKYPGNEKDVYDFYAKKPENKAHLHAPILEEKSLSYILDNLQKTSKPISFEDLTKLHQEALNPQPKKTTKSKKNTKVKAKA